MSYAIVLLSGGLDSSTLLAAVSQPPGRAAALFFYYGQAHADQEGQAAHRMAQEFRVPLKCIDLTPAVFTTPDPETTFLPGRNSLFVMVAASYAKTMGASNVAIGINEADHAQFPDCRLEWVQNMNDVLRASDLPELRAPFIHWNKGRIIELAASLRVPLEDTYTCYRGGELPCNECLACRTRADGFQRAGLPDPKEGATT